MEKQVAILDHDKAYLERLLEGLNQLENRSFSAVSALEDVKEAALLIVSSEAQEELPREISCGEVLILTDVQGYREINHRRTVYKYQGVSQMASAIEEILASAKEPQKSALLLPSRSVFLGIASPVGRSFKTSFSIVLGQLLA